MAVHLARRLAGVLLSLLAVSLIVFLALDTLPGDAAQAAAGETASASQLAAIRAEMGLNRPALVRYVSFLEALILRGDAGRSLVGGRAVAQLLLEQLPYTLALALAAIGLATLLGSAAGAMAAWRGGTAVDTTVMAGSTLGLAAPAFWVALLLIMLFSLKLRWLPVVGADSAWHLILPAVTLALPTSAVVARLVRSSLLDALSADYIRTAQAKGLTRCQVMWRHAARNGVIPVVTVLGLHLGHLLGGAFVVETIFGWPGLGRLMVQAIFDRDQPVVLGAALAVSTMYLLVNLLVDVAHAWLNPRVAVEAI